MDSKSPIMEYILPNMDSKFPIMESIRMNCTEPIRITLSQLCKYFTRTTHIHIILHTHLIHLISLREKYFLPDFSPYSLHDRQFLFYR